MTDIVRITFEPIGRRGEFRVGTNVLEAARSLGVGLASVCGGAGTCGRCRVRVSGPLSPPTDDEQAELSPEEIAEGYRLGCQAEALGDLVVSVPPESLTTSQRVHLEGVTAADASVDPMVIVRDLVLAPANLRDLRSDWSRVTDALGSGTAIRPDPEALKALPTIAREGDWALAVLLRDDEVIGFLPTGRELLGVAVDVGTTTLAAYLMSLEDGRILARRGEMNPQIAYGEDVMSRIAHATKGPEQAAALQEAVTSTISKLVVSMLEETSASTSQVAEYVAVGNTAMHHLLLGLPVSQLGRAPYVAAVGDAVDVKARDLDLPSAPGGYVHLLPNIAGFVGADHVAMLLATGLPYAPGSAVALDIGTNTEISLAHNGHLYCCSCASGPAFEGAHLRDGMRAGPGAIEHVQIAGGKVAVETIGDAPAVGICGSGVLDAIAQLRLADLVNARGRFAGDNLPRSDRHGEEYVLVPASRSGTARDVSVTRRDINEIQLAKGAIRAGIERLALEACIKASDLDELIVAGAFGAYISLDSAMTIGMLPTLPPSRCRQVGNAAGAGARQALVSRKKREEARRIASRLTYVELSGDRHFASLFPHHVKLAP